MGDGRSQLIDDPLLGQRGEGTDASIVAGCRVDSDSDSDESAARRNLRAQIDRLERQLADAFVTAVPMGGLPQPPRAVCAEPRLLDLGELEVIRDELTRRLREARATISRCADEQQEKRVLLERMLREPGRYRFARISCEDLGEPGCGVWQVRPRLGLVGMLMGWWQVKLSSGCPLAGGRRRLGEPARS